MRREDAPLLSLFQWSYLCRISLTSFSRKELHCIGGTIGGTIGGNIGGTIEEPLTQNRRRSLHFCNHLRFWDNSVASAWLDQGTRYFIFLNIVQAWCDSTVKFETRERQYSDEFQQGENLIMFQSIHLHLASNPSPSVLGLKIYWSLNFRSPPQNSIWK